jgi:hypothetical protein
MKAIRQAIPVVTLTFRIDMLLISVGFPPEKKPAPGEAQARIRGCGLKHPAPLPLKSAPRRLEIIERRNHSPRALIRLAA